MPSGQTGLGTGSTRRTFLGKTMAAAPVAVVAAPAATVLMGTAPADASTGGSADRRTVPARPGAPFSRAVILDKLVHVAGSVGRRPGGSELASVRFEPQCRQAFANLKASVEAAGSDMTRTLQCTCFLTDVDDFSMMNRVFRQFFPTSPPARSTVVVKELVVPGAKIEVDCVTSLA